MTTLVLEKAPVAVGIGFSAHHLTLDLADGRRLSVPLKWYPRLQEASKSELQNWRILGNGYAIEWPDLDEHIGVEGMLAGHASGESARSLNRWLELRAKQRKKKPLTRPRKQKQQETGS